ncbi:MAG: uL15m family ribosomal protein [Candidatus Diapherotrites archaeon]
MRLVKKMTVRKRRKVNKMRGKRLHGAGDTKNRRGSGCRGGVGRAGNHKHKFTKYYMEFGTKITLKAKQKGKAINLDDLQKNLAKWIGEKKVEKASGTIEFDGKKVGIAKILSRGSISEKISFKNVSFSENARQKVLAAGGKIEGTAKEEGFGEEDDDFEAAGENEEGKAEK